LPIDHVTPIVVSTDLATESLLATPYVLGDNVVVLAIAIA
jgi:hypothetical protein